MIGLHSIAAIESSFKAIQLINITIKWKKIFWQKKLLFIINWLKYWKYQITWDRNEIEKIWWYFSTGNFLCCIQKNQLYKSKLKICGAIADMCSPASNFCAENLRKNLKRVQNERWGLEFSHTLAQCGDESCYKIVGRESLPCCAYMFCACCGPIFTTQNSLVPIWAVFGAKWHRSPSFRVVWPIS